MPGGAFIRLRTLPPYRHLTAREPVGNSTAQSLIDTYLTSSLSLPYLHPECVVIDNIPCPADTISSGLTLGCLRRMEQGLRGVVLEPDPDSGIPNPYLAENGESADVYGTEALKDHDGCGNWGIAQLPVSLRPMPKAKDMDEPEGGATVAPDVQTQMRDLGVGGIVEGDIGGNDTIDGPGQLAREERNKKRKHGDMDDGPSKDDKQAKKRAKLERRKAEKAQREDQKRLEKIAKGEMKPAPAARDEAAHPADDTGPVETNGVSTDARPDQRADSDASLGDFERWKRRGGSEEIEQDVEQEMAAEEEEEEHQPNGAPSPQTTKRRRSSTSEERIESWRRMVHETQSNLAAERARKPETTGIDRHGQAVSAPISNIQPAVPRASNGRPMAQQSNGAPQARTSPPRRNGNTNGEPVQQTSPPLTPSPTGPEQQLQQDRQELQELNAEAEAEGLDDVQSSPARSEDWRMLDTGPSDPENGFWGSRHRRRVGAQDGDTKLLSEIPETPSPVKKDVRAKIDGHQPQTPYRGAVKSSMALNDAIGAGGGRPDSRDTNTSTVLGGELMSPVYAPNGSKRDVQERDERAKRKRAKKAAKEEKRAAKEEKKRKKRKREPSIEL